MRSRLSSTLVLACGGALIAFAALATVQLQAIKVAVWRLPDKFEVDSFFAGDATEMEAGQELLLLTFSPRGKNPTEGRLYLDSRWQVEKGRDVIQIHDAKERGAVHVKALKAGTAQLRYEVQGDYAAQKGQEYQLKGIVKVEVTAARPQLTWPEVQVRTLYKGILMRRIDLEEARGWIEQVDQGGYPAIVRVAYEIASSRESQIGIYQKGVGNQERLVAIYQHLLRRDADEIPVGEWQERLRRLEAGGITEVVMDIVRSQEFRDVHDLD